LPNANEDIAALEQTEHALRAEADSLLEQYRLRQILSQYGWPHAQGSYALRLMTWRDLDIYLESANMSVGLFFEMGSQIAQSLKPIRMSFRNNRLEASSDLPNGLYWGVRVGSAGPEGWKIDIWALEETEFRQKLSFHQHLERRLTSASRESILRIKSQFCHHPEYRRRFSSMTIYDAVLDHGVTDIEGFSEYVSGLQLGFEL
jgi:hypothetical protein